MGDEIIDVIKKKNEMATSIYVRARTAKLALEAAYSIALNATPPEFLPGIRDALDAVNLVMLECMSGNPIIGLIYASREGDEPSHDRE